MRQVAVILLIALAWPTGLVAQGQTVPVKILVELSGNRPTPERIAGLELSVTPLDGGASVLVTTDSSGGAVLRLLPGHYRIRSMTPVQREGTEYGWDVEASVRTVDGSLVVSLNRQNASAAAGTASIRPGNTVIQAQPFEPSRAPTQSSQVARRHHLRNGFWFNIGLGYGTLGCNDCFGREDGLSGGISLGGTVNQNFLVGIGTAGWSKSVAGETITVGTLDARVRVYPSSTGGFFFTGGLGLGTINVGGFTETGVGLLIGLGVDLRIGSNTSITPFWNGFAVKTSNDDGNVGQIGLSITIH
jgi:hypothetical protein